MHPAVWSGFILFILAMLAIDLGLFNRTPTVMSFRKATAWLGVWVALAAACGVFIWLAYTHHWLGAGTLPPDAPPGALKELPASGVEAATQYFTGYLVELSLSVDNIFVIAVIFGYFKVPDHLQHRVLFWGILGAIILRGVMILAGAALLARFDWLMYIFGGFLIVTAVKMAVSKPHDVELEKNIVMRVMRRILPIHNDFVGKEFVARVDGKRMATPLLVCLLVIEATDVVFAFDSIPAIFGITREPFIVFSSNLFAIMGLRTMYFGLAGLLGRFRYLPKSLVAVLGFVGIKMCVHPWVEVPNLVSLGVIVAALGAGVVASLAVAEEKNSKSAKQQSSKHRT